MGFGYKAGTAGAYTVNEAGKLRVRCVSCYSAAGGSFTIAPNGGTTGDSITLPAGVVWQREWPADRTPALGAGTVFTFTSISSYYIEFY